MAHMIHQIVPMLPADTVGCRCSTVVLSTHTWSRPPGNVWPQERCCSGGGHIVIQSELLPSHFSTIVLTMMSCVRRGIRDPANGPRVRVRHELRDLYTDVCPELLVWWMNCLVEWTCFAVVGYRCRLLFLKEGRVWEGELISPLINWLLSNCWISNGPPKGRIFVKTIDRARWMCVVGLCVSFCFVLLLLFCSVAFVSSCCFYFVFVTVVGVSLG